MERVKACKTQQHQNIKDKPDSRPAAPPAASFKASVNHHEWGEPLPIQAFSPACGGLWGLRSHTLTANVLLL